MFRTRSWETDDHAFTCDLVKIGVKEVLSTIVTSGVVAVAKTATMSHTRAQASVFPALHGGLHELLFPLRGLITDSLLNQPFFRSPPAPLRHSLLAAQNGSV